MPADIKQIQQDAEFHMQASIEHLAEILARIRAGKANPKILDGIHLDYYGSMTPLSGVASISVPDARTIILQPWEKPMLKEIEKAIINSEVGIMPDNNGELIRLSIPPLTEERRRDLVKQVKNETEDAKISIRNARREANDTIKKAVKEGMAEDMGKEGEADMQKLHDKYIKKIDELYADKEREVMTV